MQGAVAQRAEPRVDTNSSADDLQTIRELREEVDDLLSVRDSKDGEIADLEEEIARLEERARLSDDDITDLATAMRSLAAGDTAHARERLERVLDDVCPSWRTFG
jgi:archaellum component FlaC